jgi:hypothetical protein
LQPIIPIAHRPAIICLCIRIIPRDFANQFRIRTSFLDELVKNLGVLGASYSLIRTRVEGVPYVEATNSGFVALVSTSFGGDEFVGDGWNPDGFGGGVYARDDHGAFASTSRARPFGMLGSARKRNWRRVFCFSGQ